MLKALHVKNFRSLRNSRIEFSPSGLTVVIGANGSGKSNLIRCLEFIGMVPREGLEATIRAHNGTEALLPKALSTREMRGADVEFDYSVDVPDVIGDQKPVTTTAHHRLVLTALSSRAARISEESLRFHNPVVLLHPVVTDEVLLPIPDLEKPRSNVNINSIELHKSFKTGLAVRVDPPLTPSNLATYLRWFGLDLFGSLFSQQSEASYDSLLTALLSQITAGQSGSLPHRHLLQSFVDPGALATISYGSQAGLFRGILQGIKRYDLQLAELRKQQDIAAYKELSGDGHGLPSAIRTLRSDTGRSRSWERVAATLREIAPHISDASVSQLRSGQEYVQFIEAKAGRPVESWQSSDGTLRALAILLAVETHTSGVILIEEPELGLHPWAVRTLIDHIREVAAQRNIQVVLTTHSQQVLDAASPEEVRVAMRRPSEGTEFLTLSDIAPTASIEKGEVGQLWVSGLLGGVPTHSGW